MFYLTILPEDKDINFAVMYNKYLHFKSWDGKMLLLLCVCCKMTGMNRIMSLLFSADQLID